MHGVEPSALRPATLLAFLASPRADATKRRHGMDPATTAA